MRRVSMLFAAAGMLLAACGSSSDSNTGPNTGGLLSSFTANVGGAAWTAAPPVVWLVTSTGVTMSGADAGGTTVSISFLGTTPGTYQLTSASNQASGGLATVGKGSSGWTTIGQGASGTVTVTTLTPTHVVGTFSFDAITSPNGVVNVMHVTNGKFDLK